MMFEDKFDLFGCVYPKVISKGLLRTWTALSILRGETQPLIVNILLCLSRGAILIGDVCTYVLY